MQFLAPRDRDGRFWFASVQSETGQAVLRANGLPTDDWESFVLVENGKAYFKSDGFFRIVRYMTFPWPVFGIGRILPRVLADWLYDRVARNRYAIFGKKQSCMIPRPELKARFLA